MKANDTIYDGLGDLQDIENKCNARDKTISMSAEEEDSIERAKRVQIYRDQLERGEEIQYNPIV